jgi:hypothetical protein
MWFIPLCCNNGMSTEESVKLNSNHIFNIKLELCFTDFSVDIYIYIYIKPT